jgi:hypothetical protein
MIDEGASAQALQTDIAEIALTAVFHWVERRCTGLLLNKAGTERHLEARRLPEVDVPEARLPKFTPRTRRLPGTLLSVALSVPDIEPAYQALVCEANSEPELSVAALMHVVDRETIAEFRRRDEEAAERVKAIRELDSKLDQQEKRGRELANVLNNGWYATRLRAVLAPCNVDAAQFYKWLVEADHLARFTEELCGLNVSTTLMLARDRNPDHEVHVNDGRDYAFLGVAVPYGNVVVTENSWAHLANVTGLADKYETTVIARTRELPEILAREGCI